jgi:hypothetical protein
MLSSKSPSLSKIQNFNAVIRDVKKRSLNNSGGRKGGGGLNAHQVLLLCKTLKAIAIVFFFKSFC